MEKQNKKLLGFDSWTRGAHHFERLVPALTERGITIDLVHLGSWGNDPGRPNQEKIGELEVRDISFYGGKSLGKVLDIEQPDAVVFLSTETFAHRAFIRYCQQRSIPTLNLYHGLADVLVNNDQNGSYKVDRLSYTHFIYSKVGKLINYTLPCYINSLLETKAESETWIRFISDVMRMAAGKSRHKAAADAKTTRCAVYTNIDVEHAVRAYGFEMGDVFVVGNPDLARFGLTQSMFGCWRQRSTSDSKAIMYVDTGLVATGLMFSSRTAFTDYIMQTSHVLAAEGIRMLFKPHPAHNHEFLQQRLERAGVELVSNENFLAKLQECAACIVEPTTLALVPALMGMPLLYANYSDLGQLRFGPVLMSYPRGHLLQDVSDVLNILRKDSEEFDARALNDWISSNSGPLPAEEMPSRVADVVASMIRECRAGEKCSVASFERTAKSAVCERK